MIIYRLETPEGHGPYNVPDKYKKAREELEQLTGTPVEKYQKALKVKQRMSDEQNLCIKLANHLDPDSAEMLASVGHTPKQFKLYIADSDYVYAWRTLQHMRRFVRAKHRAAFHDAGFTVGVYKINRDSALRFFDGQIAFRKTSAQLMGRRSLMEL